MSEFLYERIVRELAETGWSVCADFLAPERIAALADELRDRFAEGEFRAAGIGSGAQHRLQPEIRSDRVYWLDETAQTPAQAPYFVALEELRLAINRELLLGLFDFEGHMAVYPSGSFYRRHLDQFHGVAHRKVSVILYLNDSWQAQDGGQLRIYLDATGLDATGLDATGLDAAGRSDHVDILPQGGTLACFLSGRFHHEVLPASRERLSVTGWFGVRTA